MVRLFACRLQRKGDRKLDAADDDVYPLHMMDDKESVRKLTVAWTFRFNDVLDPEKLHTSLCDLLQIGDWRKLGGRLRLSDNGRLQLRVPKQFTAERPAVNYSSDSMLNMSIYEHKLASKLPKPTDGPSIQLGPSSFNSLACHNDAPKVIEDHIETEKPVLSLHITSFSDATLIGLVWPHVLMDAIGQKDMLHAWSLVLNGQIGQVPPVLGSLSDVLEESMDESTDRLSEKLIIESMRMSHFGVVRFALRWFCEKPENRAVDNRIIFLPLWAVESIHQNATEELSIGYVEDVCEHSNSFISLNDALMGWLIRQTSVAENKTQPVTVISALNARYRLSSLLNASGVYIQNMVLATFSFLSSETAHGPVGLIARAQRQQVLKQATETQLKRLIRVLSNEHKAGREFKPFFGEPSALLVLFNNIARVKILNSIDFSSAVLRSGKEHAGWCNRPGQPAYYHLTTIGKDVAGKNMYLILGKDHQQNYWIAGGLLPRTWNRLKMELAKLEQYHGATDNGDTRP